MLYLIPSPVRRIRLFFGLALALLVVILCASLWTTARLRDAAASAARGYRAFEAATQAHRHVVLSYQAVRSYLSEGDPSYLAARRAADEAIRSRLAIIRRLLRDDPAGERRHDQIEAAVRGQAELNDRLISRRSTVRPTPSDLVEWDNEMDPWQRQIHFLIDDAAMADERAGLAESVRRAQSNAAAGLYINGIGGLIGIGVVGLAAIGTMRDLRARHRAQQALGVSEERFRAAFAHAPVGMAMTTATGIFVQANPSFCALTGYREDELLALDFRTLTHPGDVEESGRAIRRLLEGPEQSQVIEKRYIAKGGGQIWARTSLSLIPGRGGGEMLVIAQVEDVSERKQAAERLEHQASHDALTGLPNRALLFTEMGVAIEEANTRAGPLAVLLIDLDGFKEINDTHGHRYGDAVLREVGGRLRGILKPSDMVSRLGGDEFAILLPGEDGVGAAEVAGRVSAELGRVVEVDGLRLQVGASIGIAAYPEHAGDPDTLLHQADGAMYAAKRSGAGRAGHRGRPPGAGEPDPKLVTELGKGIEEGQMVLHYQPQIDLWAGVAVGVEALARWRHPREGLLPPSRFIPTAELSGLILPLDLWALEAALAQCVAWHTAGIDWSVSVNMSAESLKAPRIAEVVAGLLAKTGAAADWLTLEVTESMMMTDPARAGSALGTLRDAGVRVSIDDFGTGYSSLAYLKDLPVDEVKIDRGFVGQMAGGGKSGLIVRSIIELGHNLGLRVVAEGVEDEASLEMLISWGCDLAQGYYFSRPLPVGDLGVMPGRSSASTRGAEVRRAGPHRLPVEGGQRVLGFAAGGI